MISIVEPPKKTTAPAHNRTGTTGEDLIVLTGIRWDTYEALLTDLGDRPIHLTFDRGRLEILTLSSEHERYRKFLGRLIETMTLELRIAIASAGSTTIKRRDLQRGLESDDCYYVQSEPKVRGKLHIDIAVDVPDLAIEIDVTRSSTSRQSIYAALRVPELWRFDCETLRVYVLGANGEYEASDRSRCFPFLPVGELQGFLKQITLVDETSLLLAFQDWVRKTLVPPC
jgi:Uma2 family endonuclease